MPDQHSPAVPQGFEPINQVGGNFAVLVGPFHVCRDTTPARFGVRLTEAHNNVRGVCHGGMLMAFADHLLGYAVVEALGPEPIATISLTSEFVRAAMPGDWIEGTSEIVRITRSVVFMRGTLRRGADTVLIATGLWMRLGTRPA